MTENGTIARQRELAQALIAHEAAIQALRPGVPFGIDPVTARLLPSLTPLLGTVGFRSLLARALTLATREAPAFSEVEINEDGSVGGFTTATYLATDILIGHLIGLLTTFIGETLTLRLLRNAWPDLPALKAEAGGANGL